MDLRRATRIRPLARDVVQRQVDGLLRKVSNDHTTPSELGEMTIKARSSVWTLAHIRHGMGDHETMILDNSDHDAGWKWLINKLRIANYFLDMSEAMVEVVVDAKNPSLFSLFGDAMTHITKILDDRFLSEKSPGEVLGGYYQGEVHITACAFACDFPLRSLEDVAKNYRPETYPEPEPLSYPRHSEIPQIGA